jgi:hypothetical protein
MVLSVLVWSPLQQVLLRVTSAVCQQALSRFRQLPAHVVTSVTQCSNQPRLVAGGVAIAHVKLTFRLDHQLVRWELLPGEGLLGANDRHARVASGCKAVVDVLIDLVDVELEARTTASRARARTLVAKVLFGFSRKRAITTERCSHSAVALREFGKRGTLRASGVLTWSAPWQSPAPLKVLSPVLCPRR